MLIETISWVRHEGRGGDNNVMVEAYTVFHVERSVELWYRSSKSIIIFIFRDLIRVIV